MLRRALPLALLLTLACAATREDRGAIERIDDLIARQRFEEAVQAASSLSDERPGNAEVAEAHRRASVAYLLEQGRRATFAEDPDRAIEFISAAAELGPEYPAVQAWQVKLRRSLARGWYERGSDLHTRGDLDGAAIAYQRALFYQPDSEPAARSLAQLVLQQAYRAELGQDYYHEGVQSLSAYWLERARSRFSYADKYLDSERPAKRGREVEELLAEQRVEVARELERQRLFAAAANEYRLALLLDPELEGVDADRLRAQEEALAQQRLLGAEMDMLRGEHGRALERLAEAGDLTQLQLDDFAAMRGRIEESRLEEIYQDARNRERDFRHEEAIESYGRLLAETDFFKDARARRDTLVGYVDQAEALWAKAMATEDPAERRSYLLQIDVFWPEYRDLPERLKALEPPQQP